MLAGLSHRNADASRSARDHDFAGFTLIELLVTVALLGVLSTTLSITLSGVIIDSSSNRDASVLDAEARRASDAVRAMPYHLCTQPGAQDDQNDTNAPTNDYQLKMPAASDRPENVDIVVDWVHYWNGTLPVSIGAFQATCPNGGGQLNNDQGLQLVKITVKFHDNSLSLDRLIIKRAQ